MTFLSFVAVTLLLGSFQVAHSYDELYLDFEVLLTPSTDAKTTEGTPVASTEESVLSGVAAIVDTDLSNTQLNETLLLDFLQESYADTTGYLNLTALQTSVGANFAIEQETFNYRVVYDLTYLSECNVTTVCDLNTCFDCLAEEIYVVQHNISKSAESFGGFVIDSDTPVIDPDSITETIKDEIRNTPCNCPRTETCYQDPKGDGFEIPSCKDICEVFVDENPGCTNDNFPNVKGECKLYGDDEQGYTPYCFCDEDLLLDNIYIYGECQNMSFIVGMSAGILALILLILFIAIGCLASSKNTYKKESEDLKKLQDKESEEDFGSIALENPGYGKNWKNPGNVQDFADDRTALSPNAVKLAMEGSKHDPYGSTYDYPAERPVNSRQPNDLNKQNGKAYPNQAYSPEPGAPWDTSSDISETDAYRNFRPHVAHIDPKKNYKISRPNITVRPNDNMYNMENDKDFQMQSFRI